jgi:hypothetical protein
VADHEIVIGNLLQMTLREMWATGYGLAEGYAGDAVRARIEGHVEQAVTEFHRNGL